MTKPLLAFHDDPAIKEKYISKIKHSIAKQCFTELEPEQKYGIDLNDPAFFEKELGIPYVLANVMQHICSGIHDVQDKRRYCLQFLESIEVGSDLSSVLSMLVFNLLGNKHGKYSVFYVFDRERKDECNDQKLAEKTFEMTKKVIELYEKRLNGYEISSLIWSCYHKDVKSCADSYTNLFMPHFDGTCYSHAYASSHTCVDIVSGIHTDEHFAYVIEKAISRLNWVAMRYYLCSPLWDKFIELLEDPPQLPLKTV